LASSSRILLPESVPLSCFDLTMQNQYPSLYCTFTKNVLVPKTPEDLCSSLFYTSNLTANGAWEGQYKSNGSLSSVFFSSYFHLWSPVPEVHEFLQNLVMTHYQRFLTTVLGNETPIIRYTRSLSLRSSVATVPSWSALVSLGAGAIERDMQTEYVEFEVASRQQNSIIL
jgi:hypothetical protein